MHRFLLSGALLFLAGCESDGREDAPPAALGPADTPAAAVSVPSEAWETSPAEGVTLRPGGLVTVETGPHTVLWPVGATPMEPPYSTRATLLKHSGRIHEGYGLIFGASGLSGPEEGQRYGYFLVRGDGSYLIKLREGPATPVVRDWTRHPRIHRETGGAPRPNQLEVRVGADSTAFLVNDVEVARVASSELPGRGVAGLRVAHDVVVEVQDFAAEPGAPGGGS